MRLIQEQKEQEHKDRTSRLCKRMGFIEKLLPDTIPLTEEQFKIFVDQPADKTAQTAQEDGADGSVAQGERVYGARPGGNATLPLASLGAIIKAGEIYGRL